jgi:hypothetical protein
MKTIAELRAKTFKVEEVNRGVSYFARNCKIDFDVILTSLGVNLQRGYVWTLLQKQELIWSILRNRYIPRLSLIHCANGTFQVIDGKQRLSAMIDFYNNKFKLDIDGANYLFKDLPKDYKSVISDYAPRYCVKHEDFGETISDQYKIEWFLSINFAGTAQDKKHFEGLVKAIDVVGKVYQVSDCNDLDNPF